MVARCQSGRITFIDGQVFYCMLCDIVDENQNVNSNPLVTLKRNLAFADFCYEVNNLFVAATFYKKVRDMAIKFCYDYQTIRYIGYAKRAEPLMEKVFNEIEPSGKYNDLIESIYEYERDLTDTFWFGE